MFQWMGFKIWLHVDFKTQLCVRPFLNVPSLLAHWISHFQNPPRCFLSLSGKTKVPTHEQKSTAFSAPCPAFKTRCSEASPDSLSFYFQSCLCVYIPHATHPHWCSIKPSGIYEKRTYEDLLASLHFNDDKKHDVLAGSFELKAQLCGSGWMHNILP